MENKNYINIQYLDINYYCYKIKKDDNKNPAPIAKIENEYLRNKKEINEDIYSLKKKYKFDIDCYTCIKCNSDSELKFINFSDNLQNEEDRQIEFKCEQCPSNFITTFKKFINEMINNTYLCERCSICNNTQLKKLPEILSLCTFCYQIFCNNDICKSKHICSKNNIKLIKIKTKKNMFKTYKFTK